MSESSTTSNLFSTHDLGLASALITAGFPVDHLNKDFTQKVKFVFVRALGMDDVIQAYWANELRLSLLAFFQNIKVLKNRIYSE